MGYWEEVCLVIRCILTAYANRALSASEIEALVRREMEDNYRGPRGFCNFEELLFKVENVVVCGSDDEGQLTFTVTKTAKTADIHKLVLNKKRGQSQKKVKVHKEPHQQHQAGDGASIEAPLRVSAHSSENTTCNSHNDNYENSPFGTVPNLRSATGNTTFEAAVSPTGSSNSQHRQDFIERHQEGADRQSWLRLSAQSSENTTCNSHNNNYGKSWSRRATPIRAKLSQRYFVDSHNENYENSPFGTAPNVCSATGNTTFEAAVSPTGSSNSQHRQDFIERRQEGADRQSSLRLSAQSSENTTCNSHNNNYGKSWSRRATPIRAKLSQRYFVDSHKENYENSPFGTAPNLHSATGNTTFEAAVSPTGSSNSQHRQDVIERRQEGADRQSSLRLSAQSSENTTCNSHNDNYRKSWSRRATPIRAKLFQRYTSVLGDHHLKFQSGKNNVRSAAGNTTFEASVSPTGSSNSQHRQDVTERHQEGGVADLSNDNVTWTLSGKSDHGILKLRLDENNKCSTIEIPKTEQPRALSDYQLPSLNLPLVGTCINVYVSDTVQSPNYFIVQLRDNILELQSLTMEMSKYCESYNNAQFSSKPIDSNNIYGVKNNDNGRWYRASVLTKEVGNDKNYIVLFCDTGRINTIHLDALVPLPGYFHRFPRQAITAKLHGIKPISGKVWSRDDKEKFKKIVAKNSYTAIIKARRVDKNNSSETALSLELIAAPLNTFITDVLVEMQIARKEDESSDVRKK